MSIEPPKECQLVVMMSEQTAQIRVVYREPDAVSLFQLMLKGRLKI